MERLPEAAPPPVSGSTAWLSVPAFWPTAMASALMQQGTALYAKNLHFVEEEILIHSHQRPQLATSRRTRLDLRTMVLREYGTSGQGIPTVVDAPHAGHTASIADFHRGQSLVETLLANGTGHVLLTDWKSAAPDMKDLDIDNYLEEMLVVIDDLGGRVNLVGLCQGGWVSAMLAARFPDKVNALVLAGAPIDTDAGEGPIRMMVHDSPNSFYEELVGLGQGLMKGKFMLQGWKNMHPEQHYMQDRIDLCEHIDDPTYLAKREAFERWYENPIDCRGRWYLQVIQQLFKENRLAKGSFVGLGRELHLKDITCPLYLLAGAADDITTPEQVLNALALVGTPPHQIRQKTVPGGHIGLFMGAHLVRTLATDRPMDRSAIAMSMPRT